MYLEKFLAQWEDAAVHNNPDEPNEIHIAGDMNLDALGEKWTRLPPSHTGKDGEQ